MHSQDELERLNKEAAWAETNRLLDALHNAEARLGIERTDYTGWSLVAARSRLSKLEAILAQRSDQAIEADRQVAYNTPVTFGEYVARKANRVLNLFK